MLYNSLLYLVACYFLCVNFGVRGLMYAKSVSMFLRGFRSLQVAGVSPTGIIVSSISTKIYLGLVFLGTAANLVLHGLIK